MAAQEAENTAYGIIYFLYITAQGRSDEPRTKSCSAKASTIFESHLHRTERTYSYCQHAASHDEYFLLPGDSGFP